VSDYRIPRLLIPDNTPLSLLSMIGKDALDWLFVIEAEIWVTDMVRLKVLRDPDPADDQLKKQRLTLKEWFSENSDRIQVQPTPEGQDYDREMRNWVRGGRIPEDRPRWRDRGERSMLDVISVAEQVVAEGQAVLLLVDDRAARSMLIQAVRSGGLHADIMSTETFLALMEEDYKVAEASTAWTEIRIAAGGNEPSTLVDDPIYVRKSEFKM
jgi:hypothetical protein